jgi:hypothetical protein
MPGRTAKFVSAIFATVLAGIPLATVSHGATPAAEDCLAGPKDAAPHGSHWYYRIDRTTKRHCWYLKDEKPSQGAVANSSPAAKPASAAAATTTQRSISDAHAELPAPTAVEAPKRGDGFAPAIAADATIATPAAETERSAIGSRWPERSETGSSTVPPSTEADSAAAAPSDPDATPSAAPAAIAPAAVNSSLEKQSGPEKQPGSIQTLLLIILGALALAGLIGSAVFRFGNLRWSGRRTIQLDRQALWETANIDRRSPPVDFVAAARIRRDDIPWELRTADDPNGRIQEMLARLARSAAH